MTIKQKLILQNGVIALLLFGAIFISTYRNLQVKKSCSQIETEYVEHSATATQMKLDVVQVQQWLSDISATRAAAGFDDGFAEAKISRDSFVEGLKKFNLYYEENGDLEGSEKVESLSTAMANYYLAGVDMANGYIAGGPEVGNTMMGAFDDASAALQDMLNPFIEEQEINQSAALQRVGKELDTSTLILLISTLLSIICAVLLGLNITKTTISAINEVVEFSNKLEKGNLRTTLPPRKDELNEIIIALNSLVEQLLIKSEMATQIASGDLTCEATISSDDDELGKSFKQMLLNFQNIIKNIYSTVSMVTIGSTEISDSSNALAQGATEQAASLQEISASVAVVGSQAKENAKKSKEVNDISEQASHSAQKSKDHMEQMALAMEKITANSEQTRKVIKTIDDIAFQTNLLALNAAVEAARAGQHGKGFAVVADEVRNLANRSAKAAQETADLIEESSQNIVSGVETSNATALVLSDIVEKISKTSSLIRDISFSSDEQSENIEQIAEALEQIDSVTQQSASSAEELAATSLEMNNQAHHLEEVIHTFKIDNSNEPSISLDSEPYRNNIPKIAMY
jgi:methyl-accepting chemotaxis protein